MATVSLCMIVKNEEEALGRCLNSVKDLIDEIIIVDTGSTDRTKEIACSFTEHVFDFTWINDFSAARNYSFSKASMDYQLWLDADDILLEKDRKAFKTLKETLSPEADMVLMKYQIGLDENNIPSYEYYRERLLKRVNNYKWNDRVHEYIEIGDNHVMSEVTVTHTKKDFVFTDRNLKIYEEQIEAGVPLSPRALYYYARELKEHQQYRKSIDCFHQFLNTRRGSAHDSITACLEIARIFRILNEPGNALEILFYSFNYGVPNAEICCEIAAIYQNRQDFLKAIYWYELVLKSEKPEHEPGFISLDSLKFIPAIELCVCYSCIGNKDKAMYYNELAGIEKPKHPSISHNRSIFGSAPAKQSTHFLTELFRLKGSM